MALFRVENLKNDQGFWYNVKDGKGTGLVQKLALTNQGLPMEFDAAVGNEKWRSAAESLEQLKFWFTHEDLVKLTPLGFMLYEIHVKPEYQRQHSYIMGDGTVMYSHPLFQEQGVTERREFDIKSLM